MAPTRPTATFSLSLLLLLALPLHTSPILADVTSTPCNSTRPACATWAASHISTLKDSPILSRARQLRAGALKSLPQESAGSTGGNAHSVGLVHRRQLVRPRAEWPQINVVLMSFSGVTWQGFGTTLGRFTNFVGGLPRPQRQRILQLLFDPLRGLGFSSVRYVIPAGYNPNKTPRFQAVQGFRQDPRYPYNWNADRNQRRVLMAAVKRGATADAVSYSAPWWATMNGNVVGAARGGGNLAPKNYVAFAEYATDVVLHYARAWGVKFQSLGPFNDPFEINLKGSAVQGAASGEGCGFKLTQVPFVLKAFRAALARKGLKAVKVAGVDDWLERTKVAFTNAPLIRSLVDRITVHGYQSVTTTSTSTSGKAEVAILPKLQAMNNLRRATQKEVWVTEWGPRAVGTKRFTDFGVAMASAKTILQMVNGAGASAFVHAQAVTPLNTGYPSPFVASYGMIRMDFKNPKAALTPKLTKQFYLQQQLSRALPKGSKPIILAGELSRFVMAAYHPGTKTLSVTIVNEQVAYMSLTLDVRRVLRLHGQTRQRFLGSIYRTSSTENNHLTYKGPIKKIEIRPISVTTVFIRNVDAM